MVLPLRRCERGRQPRRPDDGAHDAADFVGRRNVNQCLRAV